MQKFYRYDSENIFTGEFERDSSLPVLKHSTVVEPPATTGDEVAHWNGRSWDVLLTRPQPNAIAKLIERKRLLIESAKTEREGKIYSNVTVPFPVDEHEIQLVTEKDRGNLETKFSAAVLLVATGQGAAPYKYTDAEGNEVNMTAQEFATSVLAIMALKDSLFYTYKALKDSLQGAADDAALDAIVANWPV